jgi:hypothetical protein
LRPKRRDAARLDVIDIQQPGLDPRHDPPQSSLALNQRPLAEILTVD